MNKSVWGMKRPTRHRHQLPPAVTTGAGAAAAAARVAASASASVPAPAPAAGAAGRRGVGSRRLPAATRRLPGPN